MATVTRVYRSTHDVQQWVVPATVSSVYMECWGAVGGGDAATASMNKGYPNGGDDSAAAAVLYAANPPYFDGLNVVGANAPGYVAGNVSLIAGTIYYLYVGGNGKNGVYTLPPFGGDGSTGITTGGGFNGGGTGGISWQKVGHIPNWINGGGGGGGATDVRVGGTAPTNRILVAGGSGGAGGQTSYWSQSAHTFSVFPLTVVYNGTTSPYYAAGASPYFVGGAGAAGYGGGATGGTAGQGTKGDMSALAAGLAATGGTQAAGGAAGTSTETDGRNGTAGDASGTGAGGAGASYNVATTPAASVLGGGGGGGGYHGGGGGGTGHVNAGVNGGRGGGGAGGSNYVDGIVTGSTNAAHLWQSLVPPAVEYQWTTPPAIFPGGAIRLTYSQPPNAPTITTPGNFGRVPVNQPFDISWVWTSDAVADFPSLGEGGADIVWTFSGVDTNTFVPPQIPGQPAQGKILKFTVPAGTLTAGRTYTLKVRVYDSTGAVSAYSPIISFRTVTAPTADPITTPAANADMTPSSFNVAWTNNNGSQNQYLYRVKVTGLTSGAALDTGLLHAGSRVNLHPDPTMKASTASWTATSGTLATDAKTDPWSVATCYKITWTTKTRVTIPFTTVPGVQYTISGYWASAASTDPAMALAAIDNATGQTLAQSATQAVAGTPGNWQRLSVAFTAISGTTLFAYVPSGGSTSVNYFSSGQIEVGPVLSLYFATSTSKDPGNTGTIGTNTFGNPKISTTDIVSVTLGPWPNNTSEYVDVDLWVSTVDSVEFLTQTHQAKLAKVNLNPPGSATATVSTDPVVGSISLHITAVDTPNATTSIDVYRSVVGGNGTEVHLYHGIPPQSRIIDFTDYTPGSDVLYAYRVRANSLSGGFEDTT